MVKTFDPSKLIQRNSFVEVTSDKLKEDGLETGDLVFVANMQALPISEDDLYNQRLHIIGHKHIGKGQLDTTKALIIDPRNLVKLPEAKNKALMRRLEARYKK